MEVRHHGCRQTSPTHTRDVPVPPCGPLSCPDAARIIGFYTSADLRERGALMRC